MIDDQIRGSIPSNTSPGEVQRRLQWGRALGPISALILGCGSDTAPEPMRVGSSPITWTLEGLPAVFVSSVEIDGDSIPLFGIRGAVITSMGEIVVAISGGGANQLVVLDSTGRGRQSIGRTGDGPGEFQTISAVFETGDEVGVWDLVSRRITFFGPGGDIRREVSPDLELRDRVVGVLDDGPIIIDRLVERGERGGLRRFVLWDPGRASGTPLTFVREPVATVIVMRYERNGREVTFRTDLPQDCWPTLYGGVLDARLIIGDGGSGQLWAVDPEGVRTDVAAVSSRPAVTMAMRGVVRARLEQLQEGRGTFPPEANDTILDMIGAVGDPVPTVWSAMIVDPVGRIWLREADCSEAPASQTWHVIGSGGERIATVMMPGHLQVITVEDGRLVAKFWDRRDVEHLAIYPVALR